MVQIALRQIGFHLLTWSSRNKDRYPRYFAAFLIFAGGLVTSSVILTAMHPAAGEIAQSALIRLGLLINITLAGLFLLLVLAFALKTFGEGVKIERHAAPLLLLAAPDGISPDVLIVRQEGETDRQFDDRANAAAKESTHTHWVVVIPYRSPVLTMFGDIARTYNRDEPIFAREEWADRFDGRIATKGTIFSTETAESYAAYIRDFISFYREWSPRKKVELSAGKSPSVLLDILKNSANILLFVLLSVSAFGQSKTAQVAEAVGTRIREIPASGADVSYTFDMGGGSMKNFNRVGNGRSNYTDLLKNTPGFFNDEGGRLVSVTVNGETIAKGLQVEYVNQSPATQAEQMRPYRAETPVMDKPAFRVPDSLQMQEYAERVKYEVWKANRATERFLRPVQDVVLFALWEWMWLATLLTLLPWIVSSICARQGFWEWHRKSNQATMIVSGVYALLLVACFFLWLKFIDTPSWVLLILAIILGRATLWALDRLNPDYRPKKGNDPNQPASTFFSKLNERN